MPTPAILAARPIPSEAGRFDQPGLHLFDPETQTAPSCPDFQGLRVYPDFISAAEARKLLDQIETAPFFPSQSGKEKQHYGPKVNFNKRKMNAATFRGLPAYARDLEARLRARVRQDVALRRSEDRALEDALREFETTDAFVLRYSPTEASNLDFHLDDRFAYGELILDLSLESDSVLTFLRGRPDGEVKTGPGRGQGPVCVRVPLPARSMAVLYGPARLEWEHAILAYDIEARRTSITLRTLGAALRQAEAGRAVLERSRLDLDATDPGPRPPRA